MINTLTILIIISIVIAIVGLILYLLETTEGKVVSAGDHEYKVESYAATEGGSYLYPGHKNKWQTNTYKYEVSGKEYQRKFIGFWVPLNLGVETTLDEHIVVHYLPTMPSVSVIVKGPGWRLMGGLLVLATSLLGQSLYSQSGKICITKSSNGHKKPCDFSAHLSKRY